MRRTVHGNNTTLSDLLKQLEIPAYRICIGVCIGISGTLMTKKYSAFRPKSFANPWAASAGHVSVS